MYRFTRIALGLACLLIITVRRLSAQMQGPFQDINMPVEKRIDNILSLLTLDEKITCLGTNPTVTRLGIKGTGHS